jgi:hypothetical protein
VLKRSEAAVATFATSGGFQAAVLCFSEGLVAEPAQLLYAMLTDPHCWPPFVIPRLVSLAVQAGHEGERDLLEGRILDLTVRQALRPKQTENLCFASVCSKEVDHDFGIK